MKHVFPINAGCFAPFHVIVPEGNMFNPWPPRPVSGTTTETAQRLVGVIMGALPKAIPHLVPAGAFGTGTNIGMGGNSVRHGEYATIFFFRGAYGLTNGSAVISAGDQVRLPTLGGVGCGDRRRRAPTAQSADLRNGYVLAHPQPADEG